MEELVNQGEDEEANIALMASTFSKLESEVYSDSESEETEHVFSHLSKSDLSNMCHDLMERCQQNAIHIQTLKKQCDLLKDELNLFKEKFENLEKEQLASMKYMSDKYLDKNELALQDVIISGYDRIKLASIIYGVSKIKMEGLSENIRSFFFKHFSKGVENTYFLPAAKKV